MDRFEQLLAQLAPQIAQAFREAIQTIVDDVVLKEVIAALEANDVDRAFRTLGITEPVYNPLIAAIQTVFGQGGQAALLLMPARIPAGDGVTMVPRFNMRDKRAEEWLSHESSSLIVNITGDARTAVQAALQQGLAEGRNPRNTALDLVGRIDPQTGRRTGGTIGLGEREQQWAMNARQRLLSLDAGYLEMGLRDKRFDKIVTKAIESGKSLPVDTVDKLVARYRDNALKFRGEQIGRTETLAALNKSEWLSIVQTAETTGFPASEIEKEWIARRDGHTRHSHAELNGQRVKLMDAFVSPVTGARFMHPGDTSLGAGGAEVIACRCRPKYHIPFGLRSRMENERLRNGR